MRWLSCFALAATLFAAPGAYAQSGRLGGAGKAISDWADREIQKEAELERAKKLAEIELDLRKRMIDLEDKRAAEAKARQPRQAVVDPEEAKLAAKFPSWAKLITSRVFQTWLEKMDRDAPAMAESCRRTGSAEFLLSCIELFLGDSFPAAAVGHARNPVESGQPRAEKRASIKPQREQ